MNSSLRAQLYSQHGTSLSPGLSKTLCHVLHFRHRSPENTAGTPCGGTSNAGEPASFHRLNPTLFSTRAPRAGIPRLPHCSKVWKEPSRSCTHPVLPKPSQGRDCPASPSHCTWEHAPLFRRSLIAVAVPEEEIIDPICFVYSFLPERRSLFLQGIINFKAFNFSDDTPLLLFFPPSVCLTQVQTGPRTTDRPFGIRYYSPEEKPQDQNKNFPEAVQSFWIHATRQESSAFLNVVFLSSELFTPERLMRMREAARLLADRCSSSTPLPDLSVKTTPEPQPEIRGPKSHLRRQGNASSATHARSAGSPPRGAGALGSLTFSGNGQRSILVFSDTLA